jgi:hypothetical protein
MKSELIKTLLKVFQYLIRSPSGEHYRYDAFISYSLAADGKLAAAIQHGLHRFAKPLFKRRAIRVFRDETTLAMTPMLWPQMEQALRSSRFFILMADPLSAQSAWVQREVDCWVTMNGTEKMLILWTGGDLVWDEARKDFAWDKTTALPALLAGKFKGEEPLYEDLRWAATKAVHRSRKHPQFASALAKLSAAIRLHGRKEEPAPDAPADLLNVLTTGGELPKQAERRAPGTPVEVERNSVDCTVFAPARVVRKQAGLLQVFLHAPEDQKQAKAAAGKFDPESKERGHRTLVLDAPIGATFAFDVYIEDFVFPERMDTLIWTGQPQSAAFRFKVPGNCKWGQHTGTVRISKDQMPIGIISFQIEVARDAPSLNRRPVGEEARHYRACFCSYSSFDRAEMLKRAQGLRATGLPTFIDVLSLRPATNGTLRFSRRLMKAIFSWSSGQRTLAIQNG